MAVDRKLAAETVVSREPNVAFDETEVVGEVRRCVAASWIRVARMQGSEASSIDRTIRAPIRRQPVEQAPKTTYAVKVKPIDEISALTALTCLSHPTTSTSSTAPGRTAHSSMNTIQGAWYATSRRVWLASASATAS